MQQAELEHPNHTLPTSRASPARTYVCCLLYNDGLILQLNTDNTYDMTFLSAVTHDNYNYKDKLLRLKVEILFNRWDIHLYWSF